MLALLLLSAVVGHTAPVATYAGPIVIAIGRHSSYHLTSAAAGVLFDIDADGDLDQVAWTDADSDTAFLAFDRNGNGTIDNGSELFGDHTIAGAENGFQALAAMQRAESGVQRGQIDARDPFYHRLLLWLDRNHDGVSQPGELQSFKRVFSSILLYYETTAHQDQHGNFFKYRGMVVERTAPGLNEAVQAARVPGERA